MAEGSRHGHIIELGKFAGKLQKLLPNAKELVPQVEEPVPTSTKLMFSKPLLNYNGSSREEVEEYMRVYNPTKVGLGPWPDHLRSDLKEASLAVFLRRSKKDEEEEEVEELLLHQLEYYYNSLNSVADELRGAYSYLDEKWLTQDNKRDSDLFQIRCDFVQMMLVDGLFVLEVMRTLIHDDDHNPVIKRVLENDDDKKRYLHDILLLQNQLPIMLLLTLRRIQRGYNDINPNSIEEERFELVVDIAKTFIPSNRLTDITYYFDNTYHRNILLDFNSALNILDVYRRCLVVYHKFNKEKRGFIWNTTTRIFKPRNRQRLPTQIFMNYSISEYVPPATKLYEAGIRFRTSASTSLLDIHFSRKTLTLPEIVVDSYTKSLFLNLIAFENLHKHIAKNEVTSYMSFMGCLVHGAEDVTLLQSNGIIISRLPSAEVAAIFNRISKDIISFDPEFSSEYMKTVIMVRERYNKLSNEWRKELFQTYLKSPWAIISLVAAFLIFTLSVIQTLYSILSYIHRS